MSVTMRPTYRELASIVIARLNCLRSDEQPHPWTDKHEERIKDIMSDAPSGSGIDCGTKIDLDARRCSRLVFHVSYHHMNDNGMYDGWTEHVITVTPAFDGVDIRISGRNRNDIKDYLHEVYQYWLGQEIAINQPDRAAHALNPALLRGHSRPSNPRMPMYYFKPMMSLWGRFVAAPTEWLMSREGRSMIAKAILLCRHKHGREEARRFWYGLIAVGVIYPQVFPRVD